jgi:hypothetical protein
LTQNVIYDHIILITNGEKLGTIVKYAYNFFNLIQNNDIDRAWFNINRFDDMNECEKLCAMIVKYYNEMNQKPLLQNVVDTISLIRYRAINNENGPTNLIKQHIRDRILTLYEAPLQTLNNLVRNNNLFDIANSMHLIDTVLPRILHNIQTGTQNIFFNLFTLEDPKSIEMFLLTEYALPSKIYYYLSRGFKYIDQFDLNQNTSNNEPYHYLLKKIEASHLGLCFMGLLPNINIPHTNNPYLTNGTTLGAEIVEGTVIGPDTILTGTIAADTVLPKGTIIDPTTAILQAQFPEGLQIKDCSIPANTLLVDFEFPLVGATPQFRNAGNPVPNQLNLVAGDIIPAGTKFPPGFFFNNPPNPANPNPPLPPGVHLITPIPNTVLFPDNFQWPLVAGSPPLPPGFPQLVTNDIIPPGSNFDETFQWPQISSPPEPVGADFGPLSIIPVTTVFPANYEYPEIPASKPLPTVPHPILNPNRLVEGDRIPFGTIFPVNFQWPRSIDANGYFNSPPLPKDVYLRPGSVIPVGTVFPDGFEFPGSLTIPNGGPGGTGAPLNLIEGDTIPPNTKFDALFEFPIVELSPPIPSGAQFAVGSIIPPGNWFPPFYQFPELLASPPTPIGFPIFVESDVIPLGTQFPFGFQRIGGVNNKPLPRGVNLITDIPLGTKIPANFQWPPILASPLIPANANPLIPDIVLNPGDRIPIGTIFPPKYRFPLSAPVPVPSGVSLDPGTIIPINTIPYGFNNNFLYPNPTPIQVDIAVPGMGLAPNYVDLTLQHGHVIPLGTVFPPNFQWPPIAGSPPAPRGVILTIHPIGGGANIEAIIPPGTQFPPNYQFPPIEGHGVPQNWNAGLRPTDIIPWKTFFPPGFVWPIPPGGAPIGLPNGVFLTPTSRIPQIIGANGIYATFPVIKHAPATPNGVVLIANNYIPPNTIFQNSLQFSFPIPPPGPNAVPQLPLGVHLITPIPLGSIFTPQYRFPDICLQVNSRHNGGNLFPDIIMNPLIQFNGTNIIPTGTSFPNNFEWPPIPINNPTNVILSQSSIITDIGALALNGIPFEYPLIKASPQYLLDQGGNQVIIGPGGIDLAINDYIPINTQFPSNFQYPGSPLPKGVHLLQASPGAVVGGPGSRIAPGQMNLLPNNYQFPELSASPLLNNPPANFFINPGSRISEFTQFPQVAPFFEFPVKTKSPALPNGVYLRAALGRINPGEMTLPTGFEWPLKEASPRLVNPPANLRIDPTSKIHPYAQFLPGFEFPIITGSPNPPDGVYLRTTTVIPPNTVFPNFYQFPEIPDSPAIPPNVIISPETIIPRNTRFGNSIITPNTYLPLGTVIPLNTNIPLGSDLREIIIPKGTILSNIQISRGTTIRDSIFKLGTVFPLGTNIMNGCYFPKGTILPRGTILPKGTSIQIDKTITVNTNLSSLKRLNLPPNAVLPPGTVLKTGFTFIEGSELVVGTVFTNGSVLNNSIIEQPDPTQRQTDNSFYSMFYYFNRQNSPLKNISYFSTNEIDKLFRPPTTFSYYHFLKSTQDKMIDMNNKIKKVFNKIMKDFQLTAKSSKYSKVIAYCYPTLVAIDTNIQQLKANINSCKKHIDEDSVDWNKEVYAKIIDIKSNIKDFENNVNTINSYNYLYYYLKSLGQNIEIPKFYYYKLGENRQIIFDNDTNIIYPSSEIQSIGNPEQYKLGSFEKSSYNSVIKNILDGKYYIETISNISYIHDKKFELPQAFDNILNDFYKLNTIQAIQSIESSYNNIPRELIRESNLNNNIIQIQRYRIGAKMTEELIKLYMKNKIFEISLRLYNQIIKNNRQILPDDLEIERLFDEKYNFDVDINKLPSNEILYNVMSNRIQNKILINFYPFTEQKESNKFFIYPNDYNSTNLVATKYSIDINLDIIDTMIENGGNVFIHNNDMTSPLTQLIKLNHFQGIEKIKANGIDVTTFRQSNESPYKYLFEQYKSHLEKFIQGNLTDSIKRFVEPQYNEIFNIIQSSDQYNNNILLNLELSFSICNYLTQQFLTENIVRYSNKFDTNLATYLINGGIPRYMIEGTGLYYMKNISRLNISSRNEGTLLEIILDDYKKDFDLIEKKLVEYNREKGLYTVKGLSTTSIDRKIVARTKDKNKIEGDMELIMKIKNSIPSININNNIESKPRIIKRYDFFIKHYSIPRGSYIEGWKKLLEYNLDSPDLIIRIMQDEYDKIKGKKSIDEIKDVQELYLEYYNHLNIICKSYFEKPRFMSQNKMLRFVYDLLIHLTQNILCHSIELIIRKILYQSFLETDYLEPKIDGLNKVIDRIDYIITNELKQYLYGEVAKKFVMNSVSCYEDIEDKESYEVQTTSDILNQFLDFMETNSPIEIHKNTMSILKNNIVPYFDTIIGKTINNWNVVSENMFLFCINQYRLLKLIESSM